MSNTAPRPDVPARLPTDDRITLVVADDHVLFREAVCELLKAQPGFRVTAECDNGRDAVQLAILHRPDVLLLDLRMPVLTGLAALKELSTVLPEQRTLLLAAEVGNADTIEALRLGARGVLLKQSASELLFKSIRAVVAGEYWVGRQCVGDLIAGMWRAGAGATASATDRFGLTRRELQIVGRIANGCTNDIIAGELTLSVKTVKHHLSRIYDKLGVANRLELAMFALEHRLDVDSRP